MNKENFSQQAYLLKCLMDNMTDHIYFKGLDSRFIMLNEAASRWQGNCAPDELVGTSDFDTYTAVDARRMRDEEKFIMDSGVPLLGMEEHQNKKDGSRGWVSTSKVPLLNEAGQIIGICGISRDITERKEAELSAARYAREVKEVKDAMEDDLRMAGELQKAFFPASYPVFPPGALPEDRLVEFDHYHSSGLVGGDLCSVLKLSETEVGIFLCDVMGHGVRAALGTAIIYTLINDLSRTEKDPGRYLERMNQAMTPILRTGEDFLFVTACYLVLDLSTGCLRLANAGHPIPLWLGGDGRVKGCMEDPEQRGPALGVLEDERYTTQECQLQPRDAVAMFTDGIFEMAGADDEEYGEQRLLESFQRHYDLPLPELFPAILKDASLFTGGKAFDDDVCLVGFRLHGLG